MYGDDLRRAVRRCLPWAEPDDRSYVLSYILQQFLIRDVISLYDPDYVSTRPGYLGTRVSFRSFILGQVPVYCRGQGEALIRHRKREMCIADARVGDGHQTWVEGVTSGDGWDECP